MRHLAPILLLALLALAPAPPRVIILGDSLARGAYASSPSPAGAAWLASQFAAAMAPRVALPLL